MDWRYRHLTASATVTDGKAVLMSVNVNSAVASSTITIKDGASFTVAIIDGSVCRSYGYGVSLPNGIQVVIAGGSPDVTIGYL